MIKANVILDHYKWKNKIKNPSIYLKKKINRLNSINSFKKKNYEFSVLLTNNKKMKSLNFKFRKKNKTTDVLSFPSQNKKELKMLSKFNLEIYLGDIIINFKKMNTSSKLLFKRQFDVLWIHGLVHLFGYDHIKDKNYKKMAGIEMKFLKKLN